MSEKTYGLPVITVSRRGAERIRTGHVWIYKSDVLDAANTPPGSTVMVREDRATRPFRSDGAGGRAPASGTARERILGTAFYSSSSEISLRMISRQAITNLDQLLHERIRAAIAYRDRFVGDTNAYRVIFSEGDFLPGLIVDRYNDLLSVQVLTQALDRQDTRQIFLSELTSQLNPRAVVERVESRVRKLEQLQEKESGILWQRDGESPLPEQLTTEFQMNDVRFVYDALGGQKTGAFLDQRENYAAAAQYARGEALDVFCYQGGFALHLARVCETVTGVDSSRPALEAAEQNATLNGREIEWIEANAFDLLRDYSDAGHKYDCVVLDPPAFAKSKREVATALRGYKELNLRALKMLRPGGILVTCSCSFHVSGADLLETVLTAANDSHRIIRVLEIRGGSKDHPSVLGIPETSYLKCLILHVS